MQIFSNHWFFLPRMALLSFANFILSTIWWQSATLIQLRSQTYRALSPAKSNIGTFLVPLTRKFLPCLGNLFFYFFSAQWMYHLMHYNRFINYRVSKMPTVKAKYPGIGNNEACTFFDLYCISHLWKNLTATQRRLLGSSGTPRPTKSRKFLGWAPVSPLRKVSQSICRISLSTRRRNFSANTPTTSTIQGRRRRSWRAPGWRVAGPEEIFWVSKFSSHLLDYVNRSY